MLKRWMTKYRAWRMVMADQRRAELAAKAATLKRRASIRAVIAERRRRRSPVALGATGSAKGRWLEVLHERILSSFRL